MKNLRHLAVAAVLAAAPLGHALAAPAADSTQPLTPVLAFLVSVALLGLAGRRHDSNAPWRPIRVS